ncbi:THO complex subunit 2 [Caerostris extrusa]|uniref:THO complex subunit 2 n=1 Tax=Caerostris extrusa TaxID=172846 RepID=A0AAV4SD85_CAEEX|nr:THO complex subunit 2 [Caerostris extrusa]
MGPNFKWESFKVWGEKERIEFVNYCQSMLEKFQGTSLTSGSEPKDLNFVLYELCKSCVNGDISIETTVSALNEILSLHPEIPSLIADILCVLDIETQSSELGQQNRKIQNRVLDVILESFECKPNYSNYFCQLLHSYFWIFRHNKSARIDGAQLYIKQLNSLSTNPANTDSNKDSPKTDSKIEFEDNQKLGLLAALIDIGDWEHAHQLIGCFPNYYATSHSFIAKKLCSLIHILIDDFYKKHSFTPHVKASPTYRSSSDGKIIRLSRYWMNSKSEVPEYGLSAISNVMDECLLPSLSLLEGNCCIAEDVWSLLKLFPYQSRYTFYYNWKTTTNASHPMLIKVKGKLSHSNPGYIFDYILSQIQTWDNLIVPVIDSLKYLTSVSYDVLACCVIEALGNSAKERMKHDGTSISLWLSSLANFGGAVFKKYPIDISGLLQHVANQLIAGKSLDLLILKEVVQKMAGIEASEEMTAEQLEAMTGGELLRSEGGYFNQMRNVKKSSQRLKESLLDQDLAIPLCLLMAQQRNCILYHESDNSHVKLVGKLYDQCQDTLVQYGSFLANNLNMEDYANRLPPVSALMTEYSIQTDVAFYLSRPSLNHILNSKFEELRKQDKSMKTLTTPQSTKKYIEVALIL